MIPRPKCNPGTIVYVPYQGRGILMAKVNYIILLDDGDIEYFLDGWTTPFRAADLYFSEEDAAQRLENDRNSP